ncbi:hypothetical protein [Virgisporangium ochraceum]|nr:hypothetical protein [Virgisporangium ochraceum]
MMIIMDNTHADLGEYLREYYVLKSAGDLDGVTGLFRSDAVYADATLGWRIDGLDALSAGWAEYMPGWVQRGAVSYPTRVLGDATGGVAFVTASPELFGGELRALAGVSIVDGLIVRFIDYWDGRQLDLSSMRVPDDQFPLSFGEDLPAAREHGLLDEAVDRLVSGEYPLATDVTLEDLTLRVRVHGKNATATLWEQLPYGGGVKVCRVMGGPRGGGFEWISPDGPVNRGITAVALDSDGRIAELCSTWDGARVSDALLREWHGSALG